MSATLRTAIEGILSVFNSFINFAFETNYPGFAISIGAVLIALFMIELGLNYIDYFLSSGNHFKEK